MKSLAFIYHIFFNKFEKIEKIGYHSNFNFECDTEKGFKESLSIELGFTVVLLLCACKLGLACLEDESSAPSKSLMLLFRDIAYTTKLLSDLLLLLLLCRRACLVYAKVTRYIIG